MSVRQLIESFREGMNLVGDHAAVFDLVQKDREEACQTISNFVSEQPSAAVDRFEQILLQQSLLMLDPDSRRRTMELYAWLKIAETLHNGRFCGFLPAA